ncbi:cupin domain-containing protein [Marinilabilia sp.]|uniref:helix-turn-helix domain-containing protein n=1 Tax=Marinilabilia sp. TaxID=2021252 RepID=UPI0025C129F8|nr:cupin domain-containing protein [Marinilabilia sp.]
MMKPGEKIRLQREDKKLDLKETAQRTQLDEKQLARIEAGEVSPSLGTLIKLARVFGVRLGTFLDDQQETGAVVTRKGENGPTDNMNAAGSQPRENLAFSSLARQKSDRHMDPFLVEVEPGVEYDTGSSSHEGEEFMYVLQGSVEVTYGKEKYELKAGDTIYYDSIVDHKVKAINNEKALLLAVVYLPV